MRRGCSRWQRGDCGSERSGRSKTIQGRECSQVWRRSWSRDGDILGARWAYRRCLSYYSIGTCVVAEEFFLIHLVEIHVSRIGPCARGVFADLQLVVPHLARGNVYLVQELAKRVLAHFEVRNWVIVLRYIRQFLFVYCIQSYNCRWRWKRRVRNLRDRTWDFRQNVHLVLFVLSALLQCCPVGRCCRSRVIKVNRLRPLQTNQLGPLPHLQFLFSDCVHMLTALTDQFAGAFPLHNCKHTCKTYSTA